MDNIESRLIEQFSIIADDKKKAHVMDLRQILIKILINHVYRILSALLALERNFIVWSY